ATRSGNAVPASAGSCCKGARRRAAGRWTPCLPAPPQSPGNRWRADPVPVVDRAWRPVASGNPPQAASWPPGPGYEYSFHRLGQTRALDGELAIGRWTDSGDLHFLRQGAPDALVGTRGRRLIDPGGQRSGQTALSARFVLDRTLGDGADDRFGHLVGKFLLELGLHHAIQAGQLLGLAQRLVAGEQFEMAVGLIT